MTQSVPNQPYTQQPAGEDPGKTIGIVGVILAIVAPLIGLIVSAVALNKSKKAGFKNTPAKAGLIIGIILTVLGLIGGIVGVSLAVTAAGQLQQVCQQLGPGEHVVGGVTYTCPG